MKLYSLGETCTVLEWRGLRIMLDCGLHLPSMQRFLPVEAEQRTLAKARSKASDGKPSKKPRPDTEDGDSADDMPFTRVGNNVYIEAGAIRFQVPEWGLLDLSSIDVILISNANNMLALPFVTEYSSFRGRIYATEPTVHIASMMMQELVGYATKVQFPEDNPAKWQNEDFIAALPREMQIQLADAVCWRSLYTRQDIEESISKVQRVSFHQHINLLGVMEAVPMSSGFSLGSANWILRTDNEKIAYIADSSLSSNRHPQPLDNSLFSNCDTMIMTCLTAEPQFPPGLMVTELCNFAFNTLRGNGSVLIPCHPAGVIFDLIEVLHTYLYNVGFTRTPMYFISPMADQALAYSNICAEWLSKPKQDKSYLPEWPFIHADLQQSGRLQHFTGVSDPGFATAFKEPCIVFCGHPSLRCGDVLHFINTWGHDPRNSIVLIEPGFDYVLGLSPFRGIKCRTTYCPIDPRLNFTEANAIIGTHLPATVVVPASYIVEMAPGRAPDPSVGILPVGRSITFRPLDVISLPSHRKQTRASLSADLARGLRLQKLESYGGRPGDNVVAMAPISAVLLSKDHKLDLKAIPIVEASAAGRERMLLGAPSIDAIVLALAERGIRDVHVEHREQKRAVILSIDSLSASVLLSPFKTKVTTADERTRHMLLEIITTHIPVIP